MSIPIYAAPSGSMFKKAGESMFKGLRYGFSVPTIFGYNQIKGKRPDSTACCVYKAGGQFSNLRAFYPTIWAHPLQFQMLKKYAYGGLDRGYADKCCDNTVVS